MNNIIYAVDRWEDYGGGGVIAVFSTHEKAKEYFDTLLAGACETYELYTMEIDNPEYKGDVLDYKRK